MFWFFLPRCSVPLDFNSHLAFSVWKKLKKLVMVSSEESAFILYMTVLHNSALTLWMWCHVVRQVEDFRRQTLPYSVKIAVNCTCSREILSMFAKHFTQSNWNSPWSQNVYEHCYLLTPRDILACFHHYFVIIYLGKKM